MRYVVALLLLGGLFLAPSSPLHAQDGRQFGITLGANWATMRSPIRDPASFLVFVGGIGLRQPLAGPMSLQSELLLNQKGAEIREENGGGSIEYSAGYLELPVLVHVQAPSFASVTVYGEAGGYGGVKLFERQTPGDNVDVSFNTGPSFFHRFNAGAIAGIGATVSLRGRSLNLTVRRTWGIPDVARDVDDQPFTDVTFPDEGRTRTWSLLLRLGF
ncbi:MAG: porin family protein [Salinibacter sp.]